MVGLASFLTVGSEVGRGNIAVPVDANGSCLALASSGEASANHGACLHPSSPTLLLA